MLYKGPTLLDKGFQITHEASYTRSIMYEITDTGHELFQSRNLTHVTIDFFEFGFQMGRTCRETFRQGFEVFLVRLRLLSE
eukprot:scaffold3069_cov215-Amphora_coffeaeformis.AAC.8